MNTVEQDVQIAPRVKSRMKTRAQIIGWIRFSIFLAIIFFISHYAIGITIINGNSMAPTLQSNGVVLMSNILYSPEREDVILFSDPHGFDVIKRIIGVPGDVVEITGGAVHVNGVIAEEPYAIGIPNDMAPVLVQEDSFFVIGDNRTPGESLDSRSPEVGLIPKGVIKGELLFSLYQSSVE